MIWTVVLTHTVYSSSDPHLVSWIPLAHRMTRKASILRWLMSIDWSWQRHEVTKPLGGRPFSTLNWDRSINIEKKFHSSSHRSIYRSRRYDRRFAQTCSRLSLREWAGNESIPRQQATILISSEWGKPPSNSTAWLSITRRASCTT